MRLPTHYYAFASLDSTAPDMWYTNDCWTKAAAIRERNGLRREGCQCGPIVRVPIPKRKRSRG